jgi:hypothetical protein
MTFFGRCRVAFFPARGCAVSFVGMQRCYSKLCVSSVSFAKHKTFTFPRSSLKIMTCNSAVTIRDSIYMSS